MVDGLHRKVEGHELADWPQAGVRGASADPREPRLGNGGVHHALGAELLQQPLCDLVGALVLRDLLTHHKDVFVPLHLLAHRPVERVTHSHLQRAWERTGIHG